MRELINKTKKVNTTVLLSVVGFDKLLIYLAVPSPAAIKLLLKKSFELSTVIKTSAKESGGLFNHR